MADIPRLPLKEFFRLFAPTYVLGTTYTVSLAFFEGLVLPEIKRSNLRRCLVLCDALGFRRAAVESAALRGAGREYTAVSVPTRYSFHPKVWLMLGEDRAAVLVGSGNLTQSGFVDNVELFDVIEFEARGSHRDAGEAVLRFVAGLRSLWEYVEGHRLPALETLEEIHGSLEHLVQGLEATADPDVRFLSSFDGPLRSNSGRPSKGER